MQKEIKIGEKTYIVRELKYKDVTKMADIPKEEAVKQMLILSTGITDTEFDELTLSQGLELQKSVNEVNGLDSFSQIQPVKP